MYKYYLMILHIIRQEEIDMNRILVLVVVILIPIAIFTAPDKISEGGVSPEVLNISLDLPVENEQDEEVQVALSVPIFDTFYICRLI